MHNNKEVKSILFRIGQDWQHRIRFGETGEFFQTCYFRGKTWGYNNIWFEWPLKVQFNNEFRQKVYMKCPKETIFPINFIERANVNLEEYDKVVDLCEPNSMYDGYEPIYTYGVPPPQQGQTHNGLIKYLVDYYIETGQSPVFNIKPDKLEKPYILFHYREATWSTYRNPDPRVLIEAFNILKEKYGDKYEFWKTGEPWRVMDRKFDFVAPYYRDDCNKFFKLINNATFMVCSSSGPDAYAEMLNKPLIELEAPLEGKDGWGGDRNPEKWKELIGHDKICWRDKDKYIIFYKEKGLDKDKMLDFTEKWL